MKNYVITFCVTLFSLCLYSQTLIPDSNFEQALLNLNIDSDGLLNGQVPTADISNVLFLDVSNQNISDLTGIEDFDSLVALDCSNNLLTSLDLSSVQIDASLDCSYNMLTTLDVSNQTSLEGIRCHNNQLTSLILIDQNSANQDYRIYCSNNLLTSLDLDGLYLLDVLDCSNNLITSLDLSGNGDVSTVLANNNNLTELKILNGQFNNQNISNSNFNTTSNPDLCCIEVEDPAWSAANWFNIDPQTSFGDDCAMTLIPDANFEQSLIDQNIDSDGTINGKVLTSDINSLSVLNVSNENISDLTGIEDFSNLFFLDCSNNNLTSLDISNNYLFALDCSYNMINSLDFSNQFDLEDINCSNNQLTSLILYPTSGAAIDTRLDCSNNLLTSLDLSGLYLLDILDCSNNQLHTLLFSDFSLTQLYVNDNNLTELDLSNNDGISFIDFAFDTKSNPNLFCIKVNDPSYCDTNYSSNKDVFTSYETDCTGFSYNCLTVEDANGFVGIQSDFDVRLDNSEIIKGFQFDITFPVGFVFNPVDITNIGLPVSFNLSCSNISGNTYRVIGFSLSADTIPIDNTAIISFPTLVGATVSAGPYTVPITGVTLSDIANNDVTTSCPLDGVITVLNSPPGDANGDEIVNILDILSTVDYIFGNPPSTFYYDLVDINEDDTINILDVLEIQDIILNPQTGSSGRSSDTNRTSFGLGDNYLTFSDGVYLTNATAVLEIELFNNSVAKGMQFDFVLPTGFSLNPADVTATSLLNGFIVNAQEIAPNTFRVLIFSLSGATVDSGSGIILNVPVFIDDNTTNSTYPIEFTNVVISDVDNNDVSTNPLSVGDIKVVDTLSIDDSDDLEDKISIYPIPTNDFLNVNSELLGTYTIYDINGRLINKGEMLTGNNKINLSRIDSGVYFIRIDHNNRSITRKIIKK